MNSAARTPADYAGRSLWLEQVGDLDGADQVQGYVPQQD